MSRVIELLARLNPTTVKFDVGRGGQPQLTAQDIAAAVGFVPAGLGREVLEAVGWPDGAILRRDKLRDAVLAAVTPEIARQRKRLSEAHLELQLAEAAITWGGRGATAEQRQEVEARRRRLAVTREQCWPRTAAESLPRVTVAVIAELSGAHKCQVCEGRREVMVGELRKVCETCKGTGNEPNPDRRRALAMGADPSNYAKHWRGMYEYVYEVMAESLYGAIGRLARALEKDVA